MPPSTSGAQLADVEPDGTTAAPDTRQRLRALVRPDVLTWLGLALVFLVVPLTLGPYGQTLVVFVGISSLLALSWNFLAQTGQVSLGHAAFVGVGAYVTALLVPHGSIGVSIAAVLLAGVANAGLGALIGLVTMRMAPWVLAIVTLAVAETLRTVAIQLEAITGGAAGVFARNDVGSDLAVSAWVIGGLVLLAFGVAVLVRRSRLRYFFDAVRLDERAAAMCGIRVNRVRLFAAALSGSIAGLAGGFYSIYIGYLDPTAAFDVHFSVQAQAFPIIGGLYTLVGPLVGALLAGGAEELTRLSLGNASLLAYGLLITTVVLVAPRGVVGVARALQERMRGRR